MQNYYEKSAYAIPKSVRLHPGSKIYPNGYGIRLGVILILHQEKQTDMTSEEKQLIKECPVILSGTDAFISYIKEELKQIGFGKILDADADRCSISANAKGIVIEYTADKSSQYVAYCAIPLIFPFDFIEGTGAIVLFPGDERSWLDKPNQRVLAADYMSGYCAFWNVEGCEWLYDSLHLIKDNKASEAALRTAAYMCAKIAANIAVGRDVKRYPRFYLCRNLE